MFSASDVRSLLKTFPQARPKSPFFDHDEPFLVPNAPGDGFLISSFLSQEFDELLEKETGTMDIADVASKLHVTEDIVLLLSHRSSSYTLLSRGNLWLFTSQEQSRVVQDLVEKASQQPIVESDFAQEAYITSRSVGKLIDVHNARLSGEASEDWLVVHEDVPKRFIYSRRFQDELIRRFKEDLDKASDEARILMRKARDYTLSSTSILSKIVSILKEKIPEGNLQLDSTTMTFRPKSYDERRKRETLDTLRSGSKPYLSLRSLLNVYPELDGDAQKLRNSLEADLDAKGFLTTNYAVSKAWFDNQVSSIVGAINQVGSKTFIYPTFEPEVESEFVNYGNKILENSKSDPIIHFHRIIIRTSLLEYMKSVICDLARKVARMHWDALLKRPDSEYSFNISQISHDEIRSANVDMGSVAMSAILQAPEIIAKAERAYSDEIKHELEPQVEEAFRAFWSEKVIARFQLFRSGLESIHDEKLHNQLTETLRAHVANELVPDAIAKSRSRGFFRVKKIRKDVEKLATLLKEDSPQPPSLESIHSKLERANSKLGLAWFPVDELASKKDTFTQDMRRAMQKDSDGARLFLATVLLLLSRQQEGLVYATGKFAPRLLKTLHRDDGGVEEDTYKKLESWKDKVKTGKLDNDDKEAMRALVGT